MLAGTLVVAFYLVGVGFAFALIDDRDSTWSSIFSFTFAFLSWFLVTFAAIMLCGWLMLRLGWKVGCWVENKLTSICDL